MKTIKQLDFILGTIGFIAVWFIMWLILHKDAPLWLYSYWLPISIVVWYLYCKPKSTDK